MIASGDHMARNQSTTALRDHMAKESVHDCPWRSYGKGISPQLPLEIIWQRNQSMIALGSHMAKESCGNCPAESGQENCTVAAPAQLREHTRALMQPPTPPATSCTHVHAQMHPCTPLPPPPPPHTHTHAHTQRNVHSWLIA